MGEGHDSLRSPEERRRRLPKRIPGEAAQGEVGAGLGEQRKLTGEKGQATRSFLRGRAIVRRSAPHSGGEIEVGVSKSVPAMSRCGLIRKAGGVKGANEKSRRAVAREHSAGAVRSVCGGGKAYHHQTSVGVSEAGDRFTPVRLQPKLSLLLLSHTFSEFHQARTSGTAYDLLPHETERVRHEGREAFYGLDGSGGPGQTIRSST